MSNVMNLENYKPKHRNRVFYANNCCYCFQILNTLAKCGSCLTVSYCSKEHQKLDWSFHKPTCVALNTIRAKVQQPVTLDGEVFYDYRMRLMDEMVEYRKVEGPEFLTEYERQICTLPWVCAVCFTSPTSIQCDVCESITYCSPEHQQQDAINHREHCRDLQLCRVFASLGYERGYKLKTLIPYVYRPIREGIKQWPKDMTTLTKLIQNDTKSIKNPEGYINLCLFMEPYIPAALIIDTLDTAGCIRKRFLLTNLAYQSEETHKCSCTCRKKFTMTIHFAIGDANEMVFQWGKIAQLLKDWLLNVDKVRFVIAGPLLKDSNIPPYESTDESVEVIVHKRDYQDIDDLPAPDVILLLECNRFFTAKYGRNVEADRFRNSLFKYSNIPVVFCDGYCHPLSRITEALSTSPDITCLVPICLTDFTEKRMYRVWKEHMSTYTKNRLFTVFMKN